MRFRGRYSILIAAAAAALLALPAAPAAAWVDGGDSAGSGELSAGEVTLSGVNNSELGGTGECIAELYPAEQLADVKRLAQLGNQRAELRADGLVPLADQLNDDFVVLEGKIGEPVATGDTTAVRTDEPTVLLTHPAEADAYTGYVVCSAQSATGTDEDYSAFAVPEAAGVGDQADDEDANPADLAALITRWQSWLTDCLSSGSSECALP